VLSSFETLLPVMSKIQRKTVAKRSQPKLNIRGRELRVQPQPPEFASRPWFPLTVRLDAPGTIVTVRNVIDAALTQLGFGLTTPVAIRLQHIKVWGALTSFGAGSPLRPLSVAFNDFIGETSTSTLMRILEQYTRYPDQVNRACVGYEYGFAHSAVTLLSIAAADIQLLNLIGGGADSVVYVHLLFRSAVTAPAAFSSFPPSYDDCEDEDRCYEAVE
jgi:hypothetical protein